jgi:hypothetical protein
MQRGRARGQLPAVDHARQPRRRGAEKDVLRDRELWNQVELLVNHANAELQRVTRPGDLYLAAADANLAAILAIGTAQDLHQRRFAGAVLAKQHVHFAGVERQVDAGQRHDAREGLPDPPHLEDRARSGHGTGISSGAPGLIGALPVQWTRPGVGW